MSCTAPALEVKAMPAADVVEVVRCRECKHYDCEDGDQKCVKDAEWVEEEYKELVRLLKDKAEKFDYDGWVDTAVVMENAADAIEKLQKLTDAQLDIIKQYLAYLTKLRWIPVAERLPSDELCFYLCYTDKGVIVECLWTNNKYGLGPFGEWGWHLMDVPQYQRVTHWMPLPEPPKEET